MKADDIDLMDDFHMVNRQTSVSIGTTLDRPDGFHRDFDKIVRILVIAGSIAASLSLAPVFAWYVLDAMSRS